MRNRKAIEKLKKRRKKRNVNRKLLPCLLSTHKLSQFNSIRFDMATADKYDRQLRLWGAGGQRKLMNSHILLVNADAVGTETLKNLVLPGVGKFTILDNKVVTPQDASANFFLPEKDIGRYGFL